MFIIGIFGSEPGILLCYKNKAGGEIRKEEIRLQALKAVASG
jgi:hypothetical protein